MPESHSSVEQLIQKRVEFQQNKLLKVARDLVPDATPEDIRNPQDFPELLGDTQFNYEDGILTGYLNIQTAVKSYKKRE